MANKFNDYALLYGLRREPTIVTDAALNVKFFNHAAALQGVVLLDKNFIRKSLTPASMQRVQRCRRTKKKTAFTQYIGAGYRRKFLIKAEWEQEDHLVFTLYNPPGYRFFPSAYDTMIEGNMDAGLKEIVTLVSAKEQTLSVEQLSEQVKKAALTATRCYRQAWFQHQEPKCYAYHCSTLLHLILEPCQKHLEQSASCHRLHFRKFAGNKMIKCDGNLLSYVIYSLISTLMKMENNDVVAEYFETESFCKLNLYSGAERPLQVSDFGADSGHCVLDSFGLAATYQLIEKMHGELKACHLMDAGVLFSITFPFSDTDCGFKETISEMLTEAENNFNIEFSIL